MLALFALCPLVSQAQEVVAPQADILPVQTPSPANCFDYYKFQSVQVSLGTEKDSFQAGEEVILKGDLLNENTYPVVDGNVFIRISEKNPNYTSEGQFIVDEFIALSNVNLDANERKPVETKWQIPEGIKKGEYRADFFFSVGKKYNLGGLPFTNEIIVGFTEFQINSQNAGTIMFDKSKTTVDSKKYNHIGSWPMIELNAKAEIVQPIKNSSKESKKIKINYDLYFWDSLNEKDKISSKTDEITLAPNKTYDLKYTIDSMKDSVYMLKITAASDDLQSIVNIRLVSDQVHPRLNYPAITKFPLQKGDNFTLFSCFHNTSFQDAKGKVVLSLLDKDGKQVDQLEYSGDISGAMMADKKDITAKNNYDYLKLKAQVLDGNNKTVDEYEAIYDCSKLNSNACLSAFDKKEDVPEQKAATAAVSKTLIALIILGIILSIILVALITKRKRSGTAMMIFFGILISLAIFSGEKAEAYNDKSVTVSRNVGNIHVLYVRDFFVSIVHKVGMTKGNYRMRTQEAIEFNYNPDKPFFNASGEYWDSPYGFWEEIMPTGFQVYNLNKSDFEAQRDKSGYLMFTPPGDPAPSISWAYLSVFSQFPNTHIVSSDSNVIECSGMKCLSKNEGTATLTAVIDSFPTKGVYFYCATRGRACSFLEEKAVTPDLSSGTEGRLFWDITVTANHPPTAPTVTGPTEGQPRIPYSFPTTATDPDGDRIAYGADFDLNGIVEVWFGVYVPSGTTINIPGRWSTVGSKTFQVLARDVHGLVSPWTQHIINISTQVPIFTCSCPVNSIRCSTAQTLTQNLTGSTVNNGACLTNPLCICECPDGYAANGTTCTLSMINGAAVQGKTYCQLPQNKSELCTYGTPINIQLDSTVNPPKWTWTCAGKNGGENAEGFAYKQCVWTEVNP